jgi:pimeloyl-ACP methyl ester carboxylesterase
LVAVDRDVRLEVLDWGGSGVPLVLLAGSGLSAHIYDEFAPTLTPYARVYAISRRGYGASSQPADGYGNQRLADDVVAVIEALHLDRPVLAGHSMAGGEITTVARQHGDRLRALIYLEALRDPRDREDPATNPAQAAILAKLPPSPVAPLSEAESQSFAGYRAWQLRSMRFSFPESELRADFTTNADGSMGRYKTPARIGKAIGEGDVARSYAGITLPILAFIDYPRWEDWRQDRKLFRPGEQEAQNAEQRAAMEAFASLITASVDRSVAALKAGAPHARIVDLPAAGHYVFLTRASEVASEIVGFINLQR